MLVLGLAVLTRWVGLGKIPGGILPDEAYGAYNAWALLKDGIDSRGYHFPVYFVAWGSGMNVLYSYLAIPLFRLFGATITVYRIPQALFGILGVYAAYVLGRELYNENFGLFFSFVLAINPWNIMNDLSSLCSCCLWRNLICLCPELDRDTAFPAAVSDRVPQEDPLRKASVDRGGNIVRDGVSLIVFCGSESGIPSGGKNSVLLHSKIVVFPWRGVKPCQYSFRCEDSAQINFCAAV